MSKSKDKGTAAETASVGLLRSFGYPLAERRALRGKLDCGDIAGIPGVVIEVKAEEKHPARPDAWFGETLTEASNAQAQFYMLAVKVKYKPVERWDAWMPMEQIIAVCDGRPFRAYWPDYEVEAESWVRMDFLAAVRLMWRAGFR